MKIQLGFILILACSISSAASPIECRLVNSQGGIRDYLLTRNTYAAFDGARPTTEFFEKGTNFGMDAYCKGTETQSDTNKKGPLSMSGMLMNSNASCELKLDSAGKGQYILKTRSMSMSDPGTVVSYEVECKL